MKEKEIQNNILEYLQLLAGAEFWEINTVGVYDAGRKQFRKRYSKFRHKGIPDIIGFYKGKFCAFEVKTPKRRSCVTVEQQEFLDIASANGQIAHRVCSLDMVIEILNEV